MTDQEIVARCFSLIRNMLHIGEAMGTEKPTSYSVSVPADALQRVCELAQETLNARAQNDRPADPENPAGPIADDAPSQEQQHNGSGP